MPRKYFWENDGVTNYPDGSIYVDGWHRFCYGDENGHRELFCIQEIAVCYKNWSDEERQRKFRNAKFLLSGTGYSRPLQAEDIEGAKREFEAWFAQNLMGIIENLKRSLKETEEDYDNFLVYQQEREP